MGPWPLHHVPDKVQGLSGPPSTWPLPGKTPGFKKRTASSPTLLMEGVGAGTPRELIASSGSELMDTFAFFVCFVFIL